MSNIITEKFTGTGAIAASISPSTNFSTFGWELIDFTLNLNAAATTSQNFTVIKNAANGAAYDTAVYTKDLAATSTTDILFTCEPGELTFDPSDVLDFAWTNTDGKTYGLQVRYKRIKLK
jgi:hypothetical protein